MALSINPKIVQRWVKDHYERFRISAEDESIFRLQECPLCGHRKWAVRFNCKSQKLTCFRCQGQVTFFELVRQQQNLVRLQDVYAYLKSYGELNLTWERKTGTDRLQALKEILQVEKQYVPPGDMDLSSFSTDFCTAVGKAILAYGQGRNIPDMLLRSGRVGYFRTGPLVGRLAFLVCENGKPVFTVGRAIRPAVQPKYLYPPASMCGGRVATDVIYNLDAVQPGDVVPVAEGIISAISADPKCQAMLGNSLSRLQASKLAARKPQAVIFLREQGITQFHVEQSAERMRAKGVPAFIADLLDGDPNDNPDQMPEVYAGAQPTDRLSKLRAMRA